MRLSLVLLAFVAAPLACAQAPRVVRPGYLEAGAFFPNYRGADFGNDLGGAVGLGYAFAERRGWRFSGEARGALHIATLGRGGGSGLSADESNLTLGSLAIASRYRRNGSPLFGGLALGVGTASVDDGDTRTEPILAAEVGYDLGRFLYVAARYQFASADVLRGATVSLGVRF